MFDILLVPFQFLLLAFMIKDRDVKLVSYGLAAIFLIDSMLYIMKLPFIDYYIKHAVSDCFMLFLLFYLYCKYKRYLLFVVIVCSLLMNIYEMTSPYQTIIYPYRDVIQWWMVEFMFIILAWKCGWRVNVKLR